MRGNGKFLNNLEKGAGCTVETHRKCLEWMAENWPEDLDWPTNIARPKIRKGKAA